MCRLNDRVGAQAALSGKPTLSSAERLPNIAARFSTEEPPPNNDDDDDEIESAAGINTEPEDEDKVDAEADSDECWMSIAPLDKFSAWGTKGPLSEDNRWRRPERRRGDGVTPDADRAALPPGNDEAEENEEDDASDGAVANELENDVEEDDREAEDEAPSAHGGSGTGPDGVGMRKARLLVDALSAG